MKKLLLATMCSILVNWVSAGQSHLVDEPLLQRVASILSDTSGHYGAPGYGPQIVLSYPQRIPLIDSYHTTYALGHSSSSHRPSPGHHHPHGHGHPGGHGHGSPYDYPPSAAHHPYNDLTSNYGPPY